MCKKDHKNPISFFLTLVFICLTYTSNAQGWTWSIFMSGGNSPFSSEGTFVAGIPGARGDESCFLLQVPSEENTYSFYWNKDGLGRSSSSILPRQRDDHHLPRSGAWVGTDSVLVLEELEAVQGGNRRVGMAMFEIRETNNTPFDDTLVWQSIILEDNSFNAFARKAILAQDGFIWVLGETVAISQAEVNLFVAKLDRTGQVIWVNQLDQANDNHARDLLQTSDGRIFILENRTVNTQNEVWLLELDNDGALINSNRLTAANDDYFSPSMAFTQDGNLAVLLETNAGPNDFLLMKVDLLGNMVWQKECSFPSQEVTVTDILEDQQTDLVIVGYLDDVNDERLAFIMKTDALGNPVWERTFGQGGGPNELHHLALNTNGGYLVGGQVIPTSGTIAHAYMAQTDINGIIRPGLITGNVFHDINDDCLSSTLDEPLNDWIVQAFKDSSTIFYANTDDLGNYRLECDTGDYIISLITPNNYWEPCTNDIPRTIGYQDTAEIDFAVQSIIDCPAMTIDHASWFVRPCDTTYIFVDYCNEGTVPSNNAFVEFRLDSLFTYVSSQIPPSSVTDSIITFPVPDLEPGECNRFYFWVGVDCNAMPGQITCSEAHIYPDSICTPIPNNWSGAFVEAEGRCVGDSVQFQLINTGNAPMSQQLNYIVIEDAVLLMQNDFDLGPNENLKIPIQATGATYHLIAEQEPGVPLASQPLAAVEGCVGSSGNQASTGFFNQFSQNDADPFVSIFCWPVTASYDPNDKQAFPTGFEDEHFIFDYTELEYQIRFQNTGTDTAFRVVLLDTLSPYLDPATIQPGTSSHPYLFEIEDNGVLRFTFNNIDLPHEDVDSVGSNGFVNFRIAQKPGNPIGTVIENSAAIYFDFNLPIITNTTFHTIHERLIQIFTSVNQVDEKQAGINVYPNPARGQVNFDLTASSNEKSMFSLIDAQGRMVRRQHFIGNKYIFQTGSLAPGIYYYQIQSGEQQKQLYSGKILLW